MYAVPSDADLVTDVLEGLKTEYIKLKLPMGYSFVLNQSPIVYEEFIIDKDDLNDFLLDRINVEGCSVKLVCITNDKDRCILRMLVEDDGRYFDLKIYV